MSVQHLFFNFDGRIPRQIFILGFFFLFCLQISTSVVLLYIVDLPIDLYLKKVTQQTLGFDLLANLLFIWPNLAIGVKRLHDIGWSGAGYVMIYSGLMLIYLLGFLGAFGESPGEVARFWQLIYLLGFSSFILFLLMVFLPGTKGDNRFGHSWL